MGDPHPAVAWQGENLMILLLCGIPEHGLPQHRRRFFADETQPSPPEPVPYALYPRLLAGGQCSHVQPKAAGFCRTDGGGNPGPLHDSWHSHRPHEAHLGFPFKVAVRPGVWSGDGAGLWLCGGHPGLYPPPNRGFFPRLYPVNYGRSTGLCIVLFSPADHRGAFGGGESAGQPASECRTGVDLEHGRAGWSLLGLVHPKHGKKYGDNPAQGGGAVFSVPGSAPHPSTDEPDPSPGGRSDPSDLQYR